MAGSEILAGEVDQRMLDGNGGYSRCWSCGKTYQVGERVVYEDPNYPRSWLVRILQHEACGSCPGCRGKTVHHTCGQKPCAMETAAEILEERLSCRGRRS